MMIVMFGIIAKRAFPDVTEGVESISFSFATLAWSKPTLPST